jgi:hypothetical protein
VSWLTPLGAAGFRRRTRSAAAVRE